ncbi:MAG TPA: RloB family protein [Thermodesulfovibrionales bacterium]|nr:RloB family protein [Thermodesulfovibrionales bacterium]
MGTDDLFHKKRIRREREFERLRKIRASHDVVLIICEGEKTEPNYFKGLRAALRLNKENIVIHDRRCGSDPLSLVNSAEEEYLRELKRDPEKQGYDHIFVVFDKDTHTTYNDALQKMGSLSKKHKGKFKAIVSVPCFEFWLLLHYEYTSRPYGASGGNSACDNVIRDLEAHISGYEKGNENVFETTYPRVDDAIKHAERLEKRQEEAGTDNPSTKVHRLVAYLQNLKNQR